MSPNSPPRDRPNRRAGEGDPFDPAAPAPDNNGKADFGENGEAVADEDAVLTETEKLDEAVEDLAADKR